MSKYTPVDEEQYATRNILAPGWYPATISNAPDGCVERLSSNGNLMFETKFQVFKDDGSFRLITAYVMAEGKAAYQLRSCAEAFGVLEEYKAGNLSEEDLKGKNGYVKVVTDIDKDGLYPDKNKIADFRKSMPGTVSAKDLPKFKPMKSKKEAEADLDDSIPF